MLAKLYANLKRRFPWSALFCVLAAVAIVMEDSTRTDTGLSGGFLLVLALSVLVTLICEQLGKNPTPAVPMCSLALFCSLFVEEEKLIPAGIAAAICCFFLICGRDRQERRLRDAGVWFLLSAGVAAAVWLLLCLCFEALRGLFSVKTGLLQMIALAVSFLGVAPFLFLGGLPEGEPDDSRRDLSGKILAFAVLPLVLALLGILIGYIMTVLIRREMPRGIINRLALWAYALFWFLHLTLTGEENRLSGLFKKYGAWLLVPILPVQIYCLYQRVAANGFTELRVAGALLSALFLAMTVLALCRRKTHRLLVVLACVLALCSCTGLPSVWSAASQENRLRTSLRQAGMLAEDGVTILPKPYEEVPEELRENINSSARYLVSCDAGPFPDSFTEAFLARYRDADRSYTGLFWTDSTPYSRPKQYTLRSFRYSPEEVECAGFSKVIQISKRQVDPENPVVADAGLCFDLRETFLSLWSAGFTDTSFLPADRVVLEDGSELRISDVTFSTVNGREPAPDSRYLVTGWVLIP